MTSGPTSPQHLGGLTYKELGKRVWSEINDDDVFGRSAELAFYFLLALFPLLFFLISILGFVLGGNPQAQQQITGYLSRVAPGQASQLVSEVLTQTIHSSSGTKLILGLLGALWTASSGMSAMIDVLDITYDVKERRSYVQKRWRAIELTVAVSVLMVAAFVLITYGPMIANAIFGRVGLGAVFAWIWKIVQWPVALFFVAVAFGLMYRFGPDVHDQKWKWLTPGSIAGIILWLVASFGFRYYLHYFGSYSSTYGSLGGVIILMLWFYISAASVLIGSEVNTEIERAAAARGRKDATRPGEQAA